MLFIFFIISFLASIIGAICGIGGGVIIKPLLDAIGILGVSEISFLSGCTVLSMAVISVVKSMRRNEKLIQIKTSMPIAIGAAIGGLIGKSLFRYFYVLCPNQDTVGAIQAGVLLLLNIGTILYCLYKGKIRTYRIQRIEMILVVGIVLGLLSAFLGIGGGPFNLIALAFFFSMETKKAVVNSLYIILFSQAASIISTVVKHQVPNVDWFLLVVMVSAGVAGGMVGSKVNNKISEEKVNKLFVLLLVVIIGI
ncbi:MAG: sulfite exporter TauE/SafE family protein, partial [Lachnospiraceae bacterium]